jgi:hypothetical protein
VGAVGMSGAGMSHSVVFDLESASPAVFAALRESAPRAIDAISRLRTDGIPLMPSCAPGEHGDLYRLKGHNRSVCVALTGDKRTSDVVVLKGSEPLLPDFDRYLAWMTGTQFGAWPRPLAEHFPLFEGKAPGTVFLAEAMAEATTALDVQTRHLEHYGDLMRLPVPLLVWRLAEPQAEVTIARLQARISTMAFERLEPGLRRGVAVLAYYYPAPPVRVHAVGRSAFLWPAPAELASHRNLLERAIPGWVTIGARLLWLGLLPTTPLSWRLGDIFDPNNACLDGGVCDVNSIHPITPSTADGFFVRSVAMSMGGLRMAIARAFNVSLGELPANYEQELTGFYLSDFVKGAMERALEAETRPSLSLDPRLGLMFGSEKSLPEIMQLVQTYASYFSATDYQAPVTES